jgi:predicted amino acid racemase
VFLEALRRRNPAFVDAAIDLHRRGAIAPGAYVLDLDAVEHNAALIAEEARRHGVEVFAMTKQAGRSPAFMAAAMRGGIGAGVAVDMDCARALAGGGMPLGHVGHLVQVPRGQAAEAATMTPEHWTVYDDVKAAQAAAASSEAGRTQALLARIVAPGDTFYRNHEGGFPAADVDAVADRIDSLTGARFAGVTTFPAVLYDPAAGAVRPTPNMRTLERAAERLRDSGRTGIAVNAPGTTSATVVGMLAAAGATHVEPGNGLTGTCPQHARGDEPELPAVMYLTEISHHHGGEAYCYGGGFYLDPVFPDYRVRALVATEAGAGGRIVDAEIPPPSAIDYHAMLAQPGGELESGATVVFGFRPQAFFTRAAVVGIRGVASGQPSVETKSATT